MNLGLEDAWVFAELVWANRLSEYNRLRRPVDLRVVRLVEFISKVVAAESRFYRFVRAYLFPLALKLPFSRGQFIRTATGLDHPLPHIGVEGASETTERQTTGPTESVP
jgi:2-polyprenyl-6-methoxyphenol hydroxylase-like FAD-dependent oxidoreductase